MVSLAMPKWVMLAVEAQVVVRSRSGVPIRLPSEWWERICVSHPELQGQKDAVVACVAMPEKVLVGDTSELLAVRQISGGRYIVVVYREASREDGFVLTAFLTTRSEQFERRKRVWPLLGK